MIKKTPAQNTPNMKRKTRKKMSAKKAYVILLIVIFAICCVFAVHQLTNSVSATVMINSILSADGKNPDRTPFNIMELFNDDVMERAAQKLGGKLTTEELRQHLTISDTMTNKSFAQLEQSILAGENQNTYFPTEYLITYSTISEQIQEEGFFAQCKSFFRSFFLPSKTRILNAVLESYKQYYGEMYLDYDSIFNIDWSVVDTMDYYNRFEYMDSVVQRISRFLQFKSEQEAAQKKTNADMGYYDLIVELSNGPMKNIENYQAYILQYGVTTDKAELLRQLAYMKELSEEENERKKQEYEALMEAIELYDATTTKVVFIPALDGNDSFYMNRTKVGLDYLSEKADAAKIQADSATHAAKHYAYVQTCFGEEYIVDANGEKKQIRNTPTQQAYTETLYKSIKEEIERLITELKELNEEGKTENREYLYMSRPSANVSLVSVAASAAKRMVLLCMAAYVCVYAVTTMRTRKQKKIQEVEQ